jgi:hypothetical protein
MLPVEKAVSETEAKVSDLLSHRQLTPVQRAALELAPVIGCPAPDEIEKELSDTEHVEKLASRMVKILKALKGLDAPEARELKEQAQKIATPLLFLKLELY